VGVLDQERTVSILDSSHVRALAAVAAVALLAGCGGGGGSTASAPPAASPSGSGASITISNFKFSPATLTVRHGARIAVSNDDSAPHTVTADDGHSFDSGTVKTGGSGTITAPRAGRYPFHCTIHAFMKGALVVN